MDDATTRPDTTDPVDRVIAAQSPADRAGHLLVLDAPHLVDEALAHATRVSVWCDDIRDRELVPPELLADSLDAATLAGVDLAWLRMPHSLGALDEYAELLAAHADPGLFLIAGGRDKHLSRSMNDTLARHFTTVRASLGQQKSRALMAFGPVPAPVTWPRSRHIDRLTEGLDVWWHGATFASGRLDDATGLLVRHLDRVADADTYLDLGSGSGILATLLARLHPDAAVHAVDAGWAAADATRLTSAGTGVRTTWASDLSFLAPGSVDVVVCNPPFHRGTAKDSDPAIGMFADAARVLGPGSEFWCVFNSHLPWKAHLSRLIGSTRLVAQDRHYTVTRSVRR